MRIVLLCPACDPFRTERHAIQRLAENLREHGHQVELVILGDEGDEARRFAALMTRIPAIADRALARRGFATPLADIPLTVARMLSGRYDVAHAFSVPGAQAALFWRRLAGGVVVFTPIAPPGRERVADRRLRLRLTHAAYERSNAVTAASSEAQAAIWRWMARRVPVIDLRDTASYEQLYRSLPVSA